MIANEYAKRRKQVMDQIGKTGILIMSTHIPSIRNGDVHFPYRPCSDFYYLTGFSEPEAILVLLPGRQEGEFVLFNRPKNRNEEIWEGLRAGQDGAKEQFGAHQSFVYGDLSKHLPELLMDRDVLHYSLGIHESLDRVVIHALQETRHRIRSGALFPTSIVDASCVIHDARLIKSESEIQLIQKAVDISIEGHERAMKRCRPGCYEYELEAEFMHACYQHGARNVAYPAIVGAGKNTCILHYVDNSDRIQQNDLILIDAGAEYQNYAADITRTFPASGRFTSEQAAIYDLVLTAQLEAIAAIRPGVEWEEPQRIIVDILTRGLIELNILHGDVTDLIEKRAYFPYYMHRSGHWLGLDVHDVGAYKINQKWRTLETGMVLTVEPGLYFSSDTEGLDRKWHHIGIRIEDDVLVTKEGCRVLSDGLIKTKQDIESFMKQT